MKEGVKILVGYDGSPYSERVLNEAIDFAKQFSGSVTVCHVYLDRRDDYSDALEALEPSLKETGVKYELRSVQQIFNFIKNSPPNVILRMADEEDFDLICIGVRGLGGAKAWLVGSVAHKVISEAKCPVLVSKTMTRDFTDGSKILVPYDDSLDSKTALKEAIDIAKKFSSPITVLNVYFDPAEAPSLARSMSLDLLNNCEPVLMDAGLKYVLRSERHKNAPAAIIKIADEENFDLISMGSRGLGAVRAWVLGSVSSKVIAEVGCSVLVI